MGGVVACCLIVIRLPCPPLPRLRSLRVQEYLTMVKTEQFRLDVLAALNTVAAARDTHADFSRYGYGT